jgi:hypothetical protein
MDRLTFRP